MKKSLLLFFGAILATAYINAQTIELSDAHGDPIQNASHLYIPAGQITTFIHVTNTSGADISARSKKIHENVATGDFISLCWGGQCEPMEEMIVPPLTKNPVVIPAGTTDESFDITYMAGGTNENSVITLIFYFEEDRNDSTYITVTMGPVEGISETDMNSTIAAYPNPATDFVNIDVNIANNVNSEIAFYNVLGKEIYRQSINGNDETIQLNTANWANGVYYYTLFNNSRKVSTQKLIINH